MAGTLSCLPQLPSSPLWQPADNAEDVKAPHPFPRETGVLLERERTTACLSHTPVCWACGRYGEGILKKEKKCISKGKGRLLSVAAHGAGEMTANPFLSAQAQRFQVHP